MQIVNNELLKFDRVLPIYNWYYPLWTQEPPDELLRDPASVWNRLESRSNATRALYFHIPFCDTICSFCPFIRGLFDGADAVEQYVQALIREVQLKAKRPKVVEAPIGAIFVGGGTPSILEPAQIRLLGQTIRDHFDLSELREFSVELEVKSITPEKLDAFREIGVTHARFGLQTFAPKYRELFDLTATLEQVEHAIETLSKAFPFVSFDMLYGMDGQTLDEFLEDIGKAVATGIGNIDFYPINQLVTQVKLHKASKSLGLAPTTGLAKFWMNVVLDREMRAAGYLPHNGHGYVRASDDERRAQPVVSTEYSFHYHKYIYGYEGADIIGFGPNAISSVGGYTIVNCPSRDRYTQDLLKADRWDLSIGQHAANAAASKGVILHLPYHGRVQKTRVNWDEVHPQTLEALEDLIQAGLVHDDGHELQLTKVGWLWYVNLIYYLCPPSEKGAIEQMIQTKNLETGRRIGDQRVLLTRRIVPDAEMPDSNTTAQFLLQ